MRQLSELPLPDKRPQMESVGVLSSRHGCVEMSVEGLCVGHWRHLLSAPTLAEESMSLSSDSWGGAPAWSVQPVGRVDLGQALIQG